jgi:ABC-type branched-subunit amino acid transport system substrate-binding protein
MFLQLLVMFRGFCSRWRVWCYVFLVLPFNRICGKSTGSEDDKPGKIEGDLILGGLFRIRKINGTNKCSKDLEDQVGIQRVEAMLYAIHQINKDKSLLPNVKLGAEIRDTCGLKTKALDESLKFILDSLTLRSSHFHQNEQCLKNGTNVVGVVGASRSTLSIEVAKLLRLFKVPQVSYASTSTELSNKNKYSYFARTVPSDSLQALAMLHVVKEFKWTSVFTINSAGSYGENGIKAFKRRIESENSSVCVVLSEQVTDESTIVDYEKIISRFNEFPSTRVVIVFLKDHHLKMLLETAKSQNYKSNVWIASDEWGTRTDVVKDFIDGSDAITLTLPSLHLTEFENYFRNLSGNIRRTENPWFQQYWQHCGNSTCNTTFNDKVPYVIDAVYAFAHALHEMYKQKCPQMKGLCNAMKQANGTELRDSILKINFTGKSSTNVSFKDNGDTNGRYAIFHYTKHEHYKKLGEWQKKLNLTNVPSRLKQIVSTCNDTCNPWARKLVKKGTTCCFKCLDCPNSERQYVGKMIILFFDVLDHKLYGNFRCHLPKNDTPFELLIMRQNFKYYIELNDNTKQWYLITMIVQTISVGNVSSNTQIFFFLYFRKRSEMCRLCQNSKTQWQLYWVCGSTITSCVQRVVDYHYIFCLPGSSVYVNCRCVIAIQYKHSVGEGKRTRPNIPVTIWSFPQLYNSNRLCE